MSARMRSTRPSSANGLLYAATSRDRIKACLVSKRPTQTKKFKREWFCRSCSNLWLSFADLYLPEASWLNPRLGVRARDPANPKIAADFYGPHGIVSYNLANMKQAYPMNG